MASIKINPKEEPLRSVLPILLADRTTGKNIIFATESYRAKGDNYGAKSPITEDMLLLPSGDCFIQPRILKQRSEQATRTRAKGEVFTPAWICCLMNNHCDEVWFEKPDLFNTMEGQSWKTTDKFVELPVGKEWEDYVDSKRLEITCGEAPFVVSRYDMATGEIIPVENRIGILDRKLRIVNENEQMENEWCRWAVRAFQSVYGYEYQGDNLFIARVNLLLTYAEYLDSRWHRKPMARELAEIAEIISWNFWQMDGLTGTIPFGSLQGTAQTFISFDDEPEENAEETNPPCRIIDWSKRKKIVEFVSLNKERG